MALTRTTSSGRKDPGASGSWAVIETLEALFEEAFSPHADDLASCGEVVCDSVIGEALVSQQDHLGTDDLIIRQRISVGSPDQLLHLLPGQDDSKCADSCHPLLLPTCEKPSPISDTGPRPYTFLH